MQQQKPGAASALCLGPRSYASHVLPTWTQTQTGGITHHCCTRPAFDFGKAPLPLSCQLLSPENLQEENRRIYQQSTANGTALAPSPRRTSSAERQPARSARPTPPRRPRPHGAEPRQLPPPPAAGPALAQLPRRGAEKHRAQPPAAPEARRGEAWRGGGQHTRRPAARPRPPRPLPAGPRHPRPAPLWYPGRGRPLTAGGGWRPLAAVSPVTMAAARAERARRAAHP